MKQARGAARRDQILHAAAAEFDEVGYAAASLSNIAARLGRTKGAMSYHFSSKASLAIEVVAHQYEQWGEVVDRVRADGYEGIDTLVLISFIVGKRFRDDLLVRAGIRLQQDAGLHDVELPTPFVGWTELVTSVLQNEPRLKPPTGVDASDVAQVLVEGFSGLQQVSYRLTHSKDILDRVKRYWLVLLPGIGIDDPEKLISELAAKATRY